MLSTGSNCQWHQCVHVRACGGVRACVRACGVTLIYTSVSLALCSGAPEPWWLQSDEHLNLSSSTGGFPALREPEAEPKRQEKIAPNLLIWQEQD